MADRLNLNTRNPTFERLVAQLHDSGKLRVWSIIVTVFGDAIIPRGGQIGLSSLQEILRALDIEANAVRTAVSRLAKDGWIMRQKVGRQSFYYLADEGLGLFESATARIYALKSQTWDGRFEVLVRSEQNQKTRALSERIMRQKGYGSPIPDMYIRPLIDQDIRAFNQDDMAVMEVSHLVSGSMSEFIEQAWHINGLNERYQSLIKKYSDILEKDSLSDPLECLAVRIMLIHDWRKLVLQDVDLPLEIKPKDWRGEDARTLVSELYLKILPASEAFLDECWASPDKMLPEPDKALHNRFSK